MDTSQGFPSFSRLPFDIRCIIWKLTLQPRIVRITYEQLFESGFKSLCNLPVALQVCRESCESVIKFYPLCFGSIFQPAMVRVNFQLDTIYLPVTVKYRIPLFMGILNQLEQSKIRYFAFSSRIFPSRLDFDPIDFRASMCRALGSFSNLQEVMIVYELPELNPNENTIITIAPTADTRFSHTQPAEFTIFDKNIINGLPDANSWQEMGYDKWPAPLCRPVYGWNVPFKIEETESIIHHRYGSPDSPFNGSPVSLNINYD